MAKSSQTQTSIVYVDDVEAGGFAVLYSLTTAMGVGSKIFDEALEKFDDDDLRAMNATQAASCVLDVNLTHPVGAARFLSRLLTAHADDFDFYSDITDKEKLWEIPALSDVLKNKAHTSANPKFQEAATWGRFTCLLSAVINRTPVSLDARQELLDLMKTMPTTAVIVTVVDKCVGMPVNLNSGVVEDEDRSQGVISAIGMLAEAGIDINAPIPKKDEHLHEHVASLPSLNKKSFRGLLDLVCAFHEYRWHIDNLVNALLINGADYQALFDAPGRVDDELRETFEDHPRLRAEKLTEVSQKSRMNVSGSPAPDVGAKKSPKI